MQRGILVRVFLFIFMVSGSNEKGTTSKPPTTKSPQVNKNLTSSTLGVSTEVVTTTTRRPLLQGIRLPCSCVKSQCGCCTGVILERFKQKACMNVTYQPDDFAFTAALSLNERVLYKNSISGVVIFTGKNPPPICIRLPRFRFIQLCVEFSNIYFANRNMHVCVDMEASWESLTLLDISFDCIRMGINGVAIIGPEEGGGVPISPIDEENQTDEDYDDSARNVDFDLNQIRNSSFKTKFDKIQSNHPKDTIDDTFPARKYFINELKNETIMKGHKSQIFIKRLISGEFVITINNNKSTSKDNTETNSSFQDKLF